MSVTMKSVVKQQLARIQSAHITANVPQAISNIMMDVGSIIQIFGFRNTEFFFNFRHYPQFQTAHNLCNIK